MKVHELKEILNNYDDTADVFFFTGYSTIPYYELLDRLDILKIEADEIAGIAAADWLKLEDISEEACSKLEKTLTAAVMKWLEKHSLKPDFYESISSVQAHGIDDYFKKK